MFPQKWLCDLILTKKKKTKKNAIKEEEEEKYRKLFQTQLHNDL